MVEPELTGPDVPAGPPPAPDLLPSSWDWSQRLPSCQSLALPNAPHWIRSA